ncbi:MAG: hypothetical protein MUC68_12695 [Burkholderiaceae bacterium]|nr:hypothetical protein [Burkholderiaceae bacterium]
MLGPLRAWGRRFAVPIAVALGIAPRCRVEGLPEHRMVVPVLGVRIYGDRRLRFSDAAYLGLFVLLSLQTLGAYITCSDFPCSEALTALTALGCRRSVRFAASVRASSARFDLSCARARQFFDRTNARGPHKAGRVGVKR